MREPKMPDQLFKLYAKLQHLICEASLHICEQIISMYEEVFFIRNLLEYCSFELRILSNSTKGDSIKIEQSLREDLSLRIKLLYSYQERYCLKSSYFSYLTKKIEIDNANIQDMNEQRT